MNIYRYRVRQVGAGFVLEERRQYEFGWRIIDQVWSWRSAYELAEEYHCEIV